MFRISEFCRDKKKKKKAGELAKALLEATLDDGGGEVGTKESAVSRKVNTTTHKLLVILTKGDTQVIFLKNKAYPLMQGCASFLVNWLTEGPGGLLETNPSTFPEHMFTAPGGKPASVSYSSTMDMQIISEVFNRVVSASVVSAAEEVGKSDDDLIARIHKAQTRLNMTRMAKDGSIMEWAQDFEDPEVHVSHLFGLFPGHTINVEETPHLCKAAKQTLLKEVLPTRCRR